MSDPERTADGRHIAVGGRCRATDPYIPESLRTELVAELMAARRAAKTGEPWWDDATDHGRAARLRSARSCGADFS